MAMEFGVLGPLRVVRDSVPVPVPAPKQRAILAVLLLRAGVTVPADTMIDLVWHGTPPRLARASVHTYVMRLRKVLGETAETEQGRLRTSGSGYAIHVNGEELDATAFETLRGRGGDAASTGNWRDAAARYKAALALWHGDVLEDVPGMGRLDGARRLTELRWQTAEDWIQAELVLGRDSEVISSLRTLTVTHPLRERFHEQLMLALARTGRPAEALEVYQRFSAAIADELGIEPGHALRELRATVAAGYPLRSSLGIPLAPADLGTRAAAPADLASRAAAQADLNARTAAQADLGARAAAPGDLGARTAQAEPGDGYRLPVPDTGLPELGPKELSPRALAQLPAGIADFTGRGGETEQALKWLTGDCETTAITVVTGPAGVGKTAFAVHVAHRLAASYPDGQLYANLRGGQDPRSADEVIEGFLTALGADPAAIPRSLDARQAAYRTALAGRRFLVLLDDARDSAQVLPLLPGAAGCAVLITSRTHLADLAYGRLIELAGLDADDALRLLASRVGAERLNSDREAAQEIVHACDGLPLALTIAAARLASRPKWRVRDLADRLQPERDRLDELAYGDLAVRRSLDLSYAALGEHSAELAEVLLLFGIWTGHDIGLQSAAALLGRTERATRNALESLADLNLVESAAADRYRLHDLVRAYVAERAEREVPVEARTAAARRVATWFLQAVDSANAAAERTQRRLDPAYRSDRPLAFSGPDAAFAWLRAELQNLFAAILLAVDYELDDLAAKLPWMLEEFLYGRANLAEWTRVCAAGLASARRSGDAIAEARMLDVIARNHREMGDHKQAIAFRLRAAQAYRTGGSRRGEANTMVNLGHDHLAAGDALTAIKWFEKAIPVVRAESSAYALASTLNGLGGAYHVVGKYDDAIGAFGEALHAARKADSRFAEAGTLDSLGVTYLRNGQLDESIDALRQAAAILGEIAEPRGEARTLANLATALLAAGQPEQARECRQRSRQIDAALNEEDLFRVERPDVGYRRRAAGAAAPTAPTANGGAATTITRVARTADNDWSASADRAGVHRRRRDAACHRDRGQGSENPSLVRHIPEVTEQNRARLDENRLSLNNLWFFCHCQ
jgi:DNA-binding SARP family transcriptional activator/tetratricopeptide (TPR) repeat protein